MRLTTLLALCLAGPASAQLYTTYHWHMQQPIYWPAQSQIEPGRYETAWESIQRRNGGAANPENNVEQIFTVPDRQAAYQWGPRQSIGLMNGVDSGAQVSFSGCLAENVESLGSRNSYGYSSNWEADYVQARNWTTSGGHPRLDLVLFPYHHCIAPLVDENALRKEIQIAKLSYQRHWGATPGLSQGFFPPEMAFSPRIIQVLAEEGIEWSFVSNSHLSRACENFPLVLGSGGENCTPPNRADVLNPPSSQWHSQSISRGCTPTNAVPFSYTPHYARHVDPHTGAESRIIVVPVAMAMSWVDGAQSYSTGDIQGIAPYNDPARPMLISLAHDGDNFYAGGWSYYNESVPNFTADALSQGYTPTVVQQYLEDHPVPWNDVVHVEDGAWVNADGDFGSPDFINWNWPLVGLEGSFDIPGGWAEDERNWAVITAAQNIVETAEQVSGGVDVSRIENPLLPGTTDAERAWHHFLPSLTSGYMYYGASLDMEVKATVACNRAIELAQPVIDAGGADQTAPTIWAPQQLPHNPGEIDFGPLWGYQQVQSPRDFHVWTFVHDASGLAEVNFRYRIDADGVNPLNSDQNETLAGGPEVGAWRTLPMNSRAFPTGNFFNSGEIEFFVLPTQIADQYWIHVNEDELVAEGGLLIDYYIEATDVHGNQKISPLLHTWIGEGGGSGGSNPGDRAQWHPADPQAGDTLEVLYHPGSVLPQADPPYIHIGHSNWQGVIQPDPAMAPGDSAGWWRYRYGIPQTATAVNFVFNDGNGNWDNNSGQDWWITVEGTAQGWQADGQLDAAASLVAEHEGLALYAGWQEPQLYIAIAPLGDVDGDLFLFVGEEGAGTSSAPWSKSGQVPAWLAYLAREVDNGWSGWFDAASAQLASGEVLEGILDLQAETGSLPAGVYLSAGMYESADEGSLTGQLPAGNGDGDIQHGELFWFPLQQGSGEAAPISDLSIQFLAGYHLLLEWSPVTQDTEGQPIGISHYEVFIQGDPWAGQEAWVHLADTSTNAWLHSGGAAFAGELFYQVRAVAAQPVANRERTQSDRPGVIRITK